MTKRLQCQQGQIIDIKFKSCNAKVFYDDKVASIQVIESKEQNKGHGKECINKIEQWARIKEIKEVWFPMVVNPKLELLLKRLGYKSRKEIHPAMKEEVEIFVKEIVH